MMDHSIIFSSVILFFTVASWCYLGGKLKKLIRTERKIREFQSKLVHAGRLSALGEMASGIAHEINQPLAIIRLKADGLKTFLPGRGIDSRTVKAADVIIAQVDRVTAITRNMRSFSRNVSDASESTDLSHAAREGVSFYRQQFRIRQIRLDVFLADNLPAVRMDPRKFEQIVVNFLSNARYAVEKMGEASGPDYEKRITVRLYHDDRASRVVFEVADNGVGMNPEVKARCLEPFFTTKEAGEGTGIGLSITHGIVKESNFGIEVESNEGEGSVFRIFAPIKEKRDGGC